MNAKASTPATTPKKSRSPAIVAATAFNRIATLDEAEAAELRQSPDEIKKRFNEKRAKVAADLTPDARTILDSMLAGKAKAATGG